jgi:hypothetical protein
MALNDLIGSLSAVYETLSLILKIKKRRRNEESNRFNNPKPSKDLSQKQTYKSSYTPPVCYYLFINCLE